MDMETTKTAGDVFWYTIVIIKEISNSIFLTDYTQKLPNQLIYKIIAIH